MLHEVEEGAIEFAHLLRKPVVEDCAHWTLRFAVERLRGRHPSLKCPKEIPSWQVWDALNRLLLLKARYKV
jgi:hypothetical protein